MTTKRIAVAGKGGTGKTTIAARLIQYLCRNKMGPVLAIDADPDSNLGLLLGIEPKKTVGDLREDILKEIRSLPPGMSKANYVEAGLHQVIEESDGFDLISMGRGEGPGCYCYLNSLLRKFSDDLFPSYTWVVMDNEAGLEHISRRTSAEVDGLLVVVNGNPISWKTAENIGKLSRELKNNVHQTFLVSNMISDKMKLRFEKVADSFGFPHVCNIAFDEMIEEMIVARGFLDGDQKTSTDECIHRIIETIGG